MNLKTGEDLSALSGKLSNLTVEATLSAELEDHLGFSLLRHHSGNSRIGTTPKNLKGNHAKIQIEMPWVWRGTFEQEIVWQLKRQPRTVTMPI